MKSFFLYLCLHLMIQNKCICDWRSVNIECHGTMCFWLSRGIWIQFPPLALSQRAREAYAMSHCPQALGSMASRVHGYSCKASHCNLLFSKHQTKSWPEVGAMSLSHTSLLSLRQTAGAYCQRPFDIHQMLDS